MSFQIFEKIIEHLDDDDVPEKNIDFIKEYILSGKPIDIRHDNGATLLDIAVFYDLFEIGKMLIDRKINVNSECNVGNSAIHHIDNDNVEFAKLLIENKANVNHLGRNYETPLHCACNGNPKVAKLLVEHKSNVYAKTTNGDLPLLWACTKDNVDLVEFLLEEMVRDVTKIPDFIETEDFCIREKSIWKRRFIRMKNGDGCTPLRMVTRHKIRNLQEFFKTKVLHT